MNFSFAQHSQKCELGSLFNIKITEALRVAAFVLFRDIDNMLQYMIEEGDLEPNVKLIQAKVEEGNWGLGYRKIVIEEKEIRKQEM